MGPCLPCACGWRPPAEADKVVRALSCKAHAFGSCGVAQAVLKTLRESLPASLSSLLQPADVWLLRLPPDAQPNAINEDAWSLTCALALHSMERGHAYLYAQRRLADVVTRASNRAVGWLSYLLSDVTSSGSIPKSWKDLPSNQPFFRCITTPRDSPEIVSIELLGARFADQCRRLRLSTGYRGFRHRGAQWRRRYSHANASSVYRQFLRSLQPLQMGSTRSLSSMHLAHGERHLTPSNTSHYKRRRHYNCGSHS